MNTFYNFNQPLPYVLIPFGPYLTIPDDLVNMYNVWSLGNMKFPFVSNIASKLDILETFIPCKTWSDWENGV